uniref:Uncharacterized protein n=1 Tax=Cacopsylla melanoneura TaxID=428564 RepID=A0A8D9EVD2_9HEMI
MRNWIPLRARRKARDRATRDITYIKQIKSKEGVVLSDEEKIKERWREYFNTLLNEENPREVTGSVEPNQGIVRKLERKKITEALSKMKGGKATGPDGVPIEGEDGMDILCVMMSEIFEREKVPDE